MGVVKRFFRQGNVYQLEIRSTKVIQELQAGDSISADGVCLTVQERNADVLIMSVVPETYKRTNYIRLSPGKRVNLEPPLRAGEFISGHFLYGHIDGTVAVLGWNGSEVWLQVPKQWSRFLVEKAAVALNGVSLTIASRKPNSFSVALIPYTLKNTNLQDFHVGERLNLEVDPIARYLLAHLG